MSGNQPSARGQKRNQGNHKSLQSRYRNDRTPATDVNATDIKRQNQKSKKQQDLS